MRLMLIGLAIVLFSLITACSEMALPRSPEAAATNVQKQNESQPSEQITQLEKPQAEASQVEAIESSPSAQLVEDLKSILAAQTGIPSYEIMVVSAEAVDWPDACLGVPHSDELCAQAITPGYRVVLSTLDKQYELHTDRSGKNIRRGT